MKNEYGTVTDNFHYTFIYYKSENVYLMNIIDMKIVIYGFS